MKETILTDILQDCMKIDEKAAELYLVFAKDTANPELRLFWENMSLEESDHVQLWGNMLKLAELDMIPQVFDQPAEVSVSIRTILEKTDEHFAWYQKKPADLRAFITAYNLEFHMLHPAFITLMQFYKSVMGEDDLGIDYRGHIEKFSAAMTNLGSDSPVMETLRDTLQRIFIDNSRLVKQTMVDGLTGLHNRTGFFSIATTMAYLAKRNDFHVGLMMIDLDDFKKINDSFGQPAGDRLLRQIGQMLRNDLRKSDILGRYGGEEFIVFMPEADSESLYNIAETLRRRVELETKKEMPITLSIGVAYGRLGSQVEHDLETLVRSADACLYQAKTTGRNRVVLDNHALNGDKKAATTRKKKGN